MSHLPSIDSVKNSEEYVPAVSPCGSMDQLLHLSTEEQEVDVESINISGEINDNLLFLDDVDIEEESCGCYAEHGSSKSKGGAENSLEDEKCAEAGGIFIEEKGGSIIPELSAQDSTVSKGTVIAARVAQETDAENGKPCSSESVECSSSNDMIIINLDEELEDEKEIKVEPTLKNTKNAQLLHISAVQGACNSAPGRDIEEHTEKPVNTVAVEQVADKVLATGDGAKADLGGGASAAAVDAADSKAAASIPDDSSLIVLTRHELELYVMLRMQQCLVAEHIAQRNPLEKKYSALRRSLVRWRCRALQLQQQLQDVMSTENEQAGLRHRPQQRSVGMLVRLPSPERQQPSPPLPLSPSPPSTEEPVATAEVPPVTMATQLSTASPLVAMPTLTSKLSHPSPHYLEPATPTVIAHSASPTNLHPLAPDPRATTGNVAQPTVVNTPSLTRTLSALQLTTNATNVPTGLLAQPPPAKQPPFSPAAATPPVPTVAVPGSMATQPVFLPSVPAGMGAPLILMAVPSGAMEQTASPQFFNPTMVAANSSSDLPTGPPFKMLCLSPPVIAAANGNMLSTEGAVGMLVQLPSTNLQQPSFAPAMVGPPVAMAGPSVAMAGSSVAMARPSVAMAGPSFAMAGPSVVKAGPPVSMATPPFAVAKPSIAIKTPVSSSRTSSPRFFHPSMAVRPSFGASQTSTVTPTQQPVMTTANATTLTTASAPSSTSKPDTIQIIIDRASRTSLPDQTGAVGRVVRLAPSELHKLASASSVATLPVTMAPAPVTVAAPVSSLPQVSLPPFLPSMAVTDTGSNLQEKANQAPSSFMRVQPIPAPACAATRIASTNKVIDLTLEEEAESTPVKIFSGTGSGMSSTASETQQVSAPIGQMPKAAPKMVAQVPTLPCHSTFPTGMRIPDSPMIPVASSRWQPADKAGLPTSARVQYYMPSCMVVTPRVPYTQPDTSGASQKPASPIVAPVLPPKGSPAVVPGGSLAISSLAPVCPPGSPSGPPAADSTAMAAKATWPETQVLEGTSFPMPNVSSRVVTSVTWSGSTQYSSVGASVHNSPQSSPPAATSSLSNTASPCVPALFEMAEVNVPIFATAEASSCGADRPKRTAADRMRDCRLRKKLATASPVKKVPKSGAQRIREFRERLKAKVLAENGTFDEQVQEHELASDSDHADTELTKQAEEDDLDLILVCDSDSCPSSPLGEENNVELLATSTASPQGHGAAMR